MKKLKFFKIDKNDETLCSWISNHDVEHLRDYVNKKYNIQ